MKGVFAVALALWLSACQPPQSISRTNRNESAAALSMEHQALGRKVYNARCYFCHGYSGDAHTVAAGFLSPAPRNFAAIAPDTISRARMLDAVRAGRPGSAMQSFSHLLTAAEIDAVVDFVREEFMRRKGENTRYHIAANGWPNHERYEAAYPFVRGTVRLDTDWELLSPELRLGKQLFATSCASCHEPTNVAPRQTPWQAQSVSFPRNGYIVADSGSVDAVTSVGDSGSVDAMTSASPYVLHDKPPLLVGLTEKERQGETLYQQNCAFCHAADGTGKNWIGSFLDPRPRDLTDSQAMAGITKARLAQTISTGIPGTPMPAWKSVLTSEQIRAIVDYVARAFYPLRQGETMAYEVGVPNTVP